MNDSKNDNTPAYLVASSMMPEGHGSLIPYGEATHPLLEKFGGELIIAGMPGQVMHHFEGRWPNKDAKFTLFKFPSMKHLMDFWNSDEYQSVKHLRTNVIETNFTFAVDGYDGKSYEKF